MAHRSHWQPTGAQTGTKEDWANDINNEIARITGDKSDHLRTLERMAHGDLRRLASVLADCIGKGSTYRGE